MEGGRAGSRVPTSKMSRMWGSRSRCSWSPSLQGSAAPHPQAPSAPSTRQGPGSKVSMGSSVPTPFQKKDLGTGQSSWGWSGKFCMENGALG